MKYGVKILSVLLLLSIIALGFNYYSYSKYNSKIDENNTLKIELTDEEQKINTDIENSKKEIEELKLQNEDKVRVLEKWQRKLEEVKSLLS